MDYLDLALKRKVQELTDIIARATASHRKNSVEGRLRIAAKAGHPQFYHTNFDQEKKCRTDVYIGKKDTELVRALAQKEYDGKIIRIAEEQLRMIRRLMEKYSSTELMEIYLNYNEIRRQLVDPVVLSDEAFIQAWEGEVYPRKPIGEDARRYKTEKGEFVRSKSEKIIADYYFHHGIPYKYEKPLRLKGIGVIYPDFTVLNVRTRKEYYHEHFGMMDDKEYAETAVSRVDAYRKNGYMPGIHLLLSFETSRLPIDISTLDDFVKWYLQ